MITQTLADRILIDPYPVVAEFYASCLPGNEKAQAYVSDILGYTAEQAAELGLGFVDRTLGTKLPHTRIKLGSEVRALLIEEGIYKLSGHEMLRGCVTEPIRDATNRIVGLRGYKLDPKARGEEVIEVLSPQLAAVPAGDIREGDSLPSAVSSSATSSNPAAATSNRQQGNLSSDREDLIFIRSDRRYRIRGLEKNTSLLQLKVSLLASRDSLCHLDVLDLTKARSRASFIKATAAELYVEPDQIKKDIGQLLMELERHQDERLTQSKQSQVVPTVELSEKDRQEALSLLRDPNLLERIVADMEACGMVGERTNKLAGYLAATSRKLATPLAVVIQSSSSAGKTSLMDAVLSLMPPEDVQRFSGITGQSLYYLESDKIKHKILAISEDAGIGTAVYSLKLLQSDGELRHATVGRGQHGHAQTQEHHVQGPVQVFLTTTAMEIDEELANRCLVLSVDETHDQTSAIQSRQRQAFTLDVDQHHSLAGSLRTRHRNAQRLLKPLKVFNPYAPQLTFPSHKTRLRRDQMKYLTLINTIAFLHQHQRPTESLSTSAGIVEYISVTRADITVANRLAGEILGRSLDELAPQTRSLLELLHTMVKQGAKQQRVPKDAFRFTRRDVRESLHWNDSQVNKHLKRLVELEYVLTHRGRSGQRYVYELLYGGEGTCGKPFFMGLADASNLLESTPTTQTLTP